MTNRRFYGVCLALVGLLAMAGSILFRSDSVYAQNAGNTGTQTTSIQLLNASSSTGRTVVPQTKNIGAGMHTVTYCTTATSIQIQIEASPDNNSAHYAVISPVGGVPITINGCGVLQAGGFYTYIAIDVVSITGGSVSAWYSATTGPISVTPVFQTSNGATSQPVCDTPVFQGSISNSSSVLLVTAPGATKHIYFCGLTLSYSSAPSSGSIGINAGTGATCATSPTTIWDVATGATSPLVVQAPPLAIPLVNGSLNVCVSNASGVTVTAIANIAEY